MPELEELYRLQQFDNDIDRIKNTLDDQSILKEIEEIELKITNLQKKIKTKDQNKEELNNELKNKEYENNKLNSQIKNYKDQLYNGESNPKELEQLQSKMNELKEQQSELEDEILDVMMKLENLVEDKEELNNKLETYRNDLTKFQKNYKERQIKLNEELEEVKKVRDKLNNDLDDTLIAKYNRLKEKKAGLVVVELNDGYCMGCRVGLSTKNAEAVKNSNEMIKCENCGRILYWTGEE
ncbi:zinc ribbon domain-containing protein [Selenihalanaerobacter shriftii]|uniref:Uncharacterized protein n=1 Tax=Selenihalanaerobacter shriftii TaxID=142842 RepID=A0A1T4MYC9_9FIRM|nr:C4-type zinc ribbon domain-containing protein [Selenihalanaerobacter shriftii]SJZ71844.1 hypothetical protein SAMN02745118_01638 [Selenihalanaerobacter shriftii]